VTFSQRFRIIIASEREKVMLRIALFAIVLVTSLPSVAVNNVTTFETCYRERAKKIPSIAEKSFLDAYLKYLKSGTKENGEEAIEQMSALAKTQGGRFSTQWAGIFEGAIDLCCGGPQTCTESFGSATAQALMPRVERGWITAINLVLTYEKLAKTDGAEAENLQDFVEVIRKKHPWGIKAFDKSFVKP
jgi:hypothetical protein